MEKEKLFPNEKIIVTKNFDVHQDWAVPIPGFFIIASVRKIRSILEFSDEERDEFFRLVFRLRKGMLDVLNIEKVYLFEDESTQHQLFHLWILPRYPWMDKFGHKVESIRPIIEYAKENMCDDENMKEVKNCVLKMREYMKE